MSARFNVIMTGIALLLTVIAVGLPKKYQDVAVGLCIVAATIVAACIIVAVLL